VEKVHIEELNDQYYSSTIAWVIKLRNLEGGACSTYGKEEKRVQVLVRKHEQ
jgi:hypothetical protein